MDQKPTFVLRLSSKKFHRKYCLCRVCYYDDGWSNRHFGKNCFICCSYTLLVIFTWEAHEWRKPIRHGCMGTGYRGIVHCVWHGDCLFNTQANGDTVQRSFSTIRDWEWYYYLVIAGKCIRIYSTVLGLATHATTTQSQALIHLISGMKKILSKSEFFTKKVDPQNIFHTQYVLSTRSFNWPLGALHCLKLMEYFPPRVMQ